MVLARSRDAGAGVGVILRIVADAPGDCGAQILFQEFWIVGSLWHLGVCWVRRLILCLGSGRPRQGLNDVFGPRTADGINEVSIDEEISTEADER